MTIPIPDFWRLLIESQLLPAEECQRLGQQFGHVKGAAAQGNARTLSEWLVSQNVISRYQATILLGGRAGPFAYGDYKIYDRIDGGPLAGQFKAVHATTGHPVCLKFFAGETVADANRWASTANRAIGHLGLNHPHWWRGFELADLDQYKFFAVADVSGQFVSQRLQNGQRIDHAQACRFAYQAALALSRAHEAGFTHGDVRPENIVIDGQNRAVLWCDPATPLAGFASASDDAATAARADYAAPELGVAGNSPNALTDVYALGCTLYHMLAGEPPFAGGSVSQKMQRHASEAIQPLAQFGVPEPVTKVVAFMMAKNAGVRYQTASQAADQLGQFLPSDQRQPIVTPARPTLAAYEQHLKQKPKPTPRPISQVNTQSTQPSVPLVVPVTTSGEAASGGTPATVTAAKQSAVTSPSASDRFKNKKPITKNLPLMITLGAGAAFLLTVCVIGVLPLLGIGFAVANLTSDDGTEAAADEGSADDGATTDGDSPDGNSTDGSEPADGTDDGSAADGATTGGEDDGPRFNVVAVDDGNSLWAPPTMGDPVEMVFVPSAARMYLIARPADILASGHGRNALKALGPDFASWRQQWERDAGVTFDEVEQLIVGVHPNNSQMPRFSYTVTLKNRLDMKTRWGNPAAGANNVFPVAGRKAWLAPGGDGRVFVLGAGDEIDELAALGVPRPKAQVDPYFNQLLKASDAEQHFIALVDPQFLYTDGRDMFRGPYEKLIEPLQWFFGDDTKAMITTSFTDDFYGELRLYSRLQKTPADMRNEYGGRIRELPARVRNYMVELDPPTYWRNLYLSIPDMVSVTTAQTRSGIEGEETVFNFALPGQAAPNLIAAAELSIATAPGATFNPPNTGGTPTSKPDPKTLDEVLAASVDLGFPQQSLEFSMRDLVAAVKDEYPSLPVDFQIKILGADLQKDGITRNQQIRDVNVKDTPVSEILTQLVRKANPVTTVTDASEVDQKLVWLIGPDPDDASKKIVLITTRTAAGEKNWTLPAVFQPK